MNIKNIIICIKNIIVCIKDITLGCLRSGGFLSRSLKMLCLNVGLDFISISFGYLGSEQLVVYLLEELVFVQRFALNAQSSCHVLA